MHPWISMDASMDIHGCIHGYPLLYGYPSSITHMDIGMDIHMDIHDMDF